MAATPAKSGVQGLRRVLGTWDLVLLNIAAIVGLRWLSTAAQIGPSSLVMWVLGLSFFLIPLALAVLELSSRVPGEGGLYLWTKAAFGDMHGFIAGWTYWISNLVFLPSVLLFSAGIFLHVGGDNWLANSGNGTYNAVYALLVLWSATGLGVLGMERAKWLQNIGGIATWTAAALILGAGAWAGFKFGPATAFTAASLMPDFGQLATYSTLATVALAFAGLELGPVLGGEMRDARRQIPRATLISCIVITAIYICGTASLLIALPTAMIDVIGGIPQALAAVGERLELPYFGQLTAFLITLSTIGAVSAWISGTSRMPFVVGVDRYLPAALARLHPTHGTPYVSLLVQGVLASLILLASLSGSSIHEAFVILIDMTAILSMLPLLYIMAAYPILRRRAAGRNEGVTLTPGGSIVCWLAGSIGFATTLVAILTSMIPPGGNQNPALFLLKVVGGSALLIGIGLIFYLKGHRTRILG